MSREKTQLFCPGTSDLNGTGKGLIMSSTTLILLILILIMFPYQNAPTEPQTVHAERNQYTCDVCKKSFVRRKTFWNHWLARHEERPLVEWWLMDRNWSSCNKAWSIVSLSTRNLMLTVQGSNCCLWSETFTESLELWYDLSYTALCYIMLYVTALVVLCCANILRVCSFILRDSVHVCANIYVAICTITCKAPTMLWHCSVHAILNISCCTISTVNTCCTEAVQYRTLSLWPPYIW